VLDALAALELPATFFVIGQQVPERAAVLRRMVEAGHAVGVHAWEHPDLGAEPERAPDEIDRCLAAVREAAGLAPDLFRPPFGSYTPAVLEHADARGLRTILWDVNPHDHAGGDATADSITADVLAGVRRGSIVVLHDGGPLDSRTRVLDALPRIADGLRERRLEAVTVPDLIA
jgi:peptidoglycan/xylan/chitin deacetylase (PgdA/CDA1 family)